MSVMIQAERPDTPDALQLIEELEGVLSPLYPSESRHGFSVEKLLREGVAFFVMRKDQQAAGCGGVKLFGTDFAEVKRMYVRPQYRGQGMARIMLDQLAQHSLENGVNLLRLETGIHQTEAIRLYERYGFQRISHFADYPDDPLSLFFEKRI